jgi:MFS family permease
MLSPTPDAMSREEIRAGASLASIFALRMLGLFLILPVFAIHAQGIPGGDNLTLVGIALGAYGLTQAMFQIPFGMAADAYGRKKVIVIGLLIFAFGSAVAALAPDIWWAIAGRVLQGAGAISAAVTALAADLTREQHRTKVMAMIGSSIGLMFAFSLVAAPALYAVIGMAGIFWLTAILALAAIGLVTHVVPPAPPLPPGPRPAFREVMFNPSLLRLNLGIFTLHAVQMAMFVVVPGLLVRYGDLPVASHWKVYLPAVLASFVLMVPAIIVAEKRNKVQPVFVGAVCPAAGYAAGDVGRQHKFRGGRRWPAELLRRLQHPRGHAALADFAHRAGAGQGRGAGHLQHHPGAGPVRRRRARRLAGAAFRCRRGVPVRRAHGGGLAGRRR